jgi:lactate dehydrogenase-like 2-hydroxyacid dehydrogenase
MIFSMFMLVRCWLCAVTCQQDESNRGMVNAELLGHCKPGVRIVNVARGKQQHAPLGG